MHTFPKKGQPDQEKNVLSQAWFKYFPYWPLFLILLVIAGAGAWFYVRYKTSPYYIATASILIKDEKKGQDEAKMLESLNQLSAKKNYRKRNRSDPVQGIAFPGGQETSSLCAYLRKT